MRFLILLTVFLVTGGSHLTHAKSSLDSSLYFNVNEDQILDTKILQRNTRWIKSNPDKVIILEGHCDERGSREFNLELGDRRARSVMRALLEKGVSEDQLIVVSYGKDRPLITKRSEEGWAKNRRVDFVIR